MKKLLSISLLFALIFALAETKAQSGSGSGCAENLCYSGGGTGTLDVSYTAGYDDTINATLVKTGDTVTTTGSTSYGTTFNATSQVSTQDDGSQIVVTTTSTSNFDGGSSGTETSTYNVDNDTDSSSGYLTTNTGSGSVQYNVNLSSKDNTYSGTATLYENGVEVNSQENSGGFKRF
jgi:hypothetical protein